MSVIWWGRFLNQYVLLRKEELHSLNKLIHNFHSGSHECIHFVYSVASYVIVTGCYAIIADSKLFIYRYSRASLSDREMLWEMRRQVIMSLCKHHR
jgi:hypothetical protein